VVERSLKIRNCPKKLLEKICLKKLRALVLETFSGKMRARAYACLCNVDNHFQFFFWGGGVDNSIAQQIFAGKES
jgi:hypothetical protein